MAERKYFYTDSDGATRKYVYCSLCGEGPYREIEEGIKYIESGQDLKYCKRCAKELRLNVVFAEENDPIKIEENEIKIAVEEKKEKDACENKKPYIQESASEESLLDRLIITRKSSDITVKQILKDESITDTRTVYKIKGHNGQVITGVSKDFRKMLYYIYRGKGPTEFRKKVKPIRILSYKAFNDNKEALEYKQKLDDKIKDNKGPISSLVFNLDEKYLSKIKLTNNDSSI